MKLSHTEIEKLIPHSGLMCLLENVLSYDQQTIDCQVTSHQDLNHPLRNNHQLHALNGIEYAAQASALHLALREQHDAPQQGVLASIQHCDMQVDRLDNIKSELVVTAKFLFASPKAGAIYEFEIKAGQTMCLNGRLLIIFSKGSTP